MMIMHDFKGKGHEFRRQATSFHAPPRLDTAVLLQFAETATRLLQEKADRKESGMAALRVMYGKRG